MEDKAFKIIPEGERAQRKAELQLALRHAGNKGFGVLFNQLRRYEDHWSEVRAALNEAIVAYVEDAYVAQEDAFPEDAIKEEMMTGLEEDLDYILSENREHFEQMHRNSREELIGYGLAEDPEEEEEREAAECAARRQEEQNLLRQLNQVQGNYIATPS